MKFTNVAWSQRHSLSGVNEAFLIDDTWDDYGYQTYFGLVVFDQIGTRIDLGGVKILKKGMTGGRTQTPPQFPILDETYCSLGQSEDYYEALGGLSGGLGDQILIGLRDCVHDSNVLANFQTENGFQVSLLRVVTLSRLSNTFAAALRGQAPLTPFRFSYTFPAGG